MRTTCTDRRVVGFLKDVIRKLFEEKLNLLTLEHKIYEEISWIGF